MKIKNMKIKKLVLSVALLITSTLFGQISTTKIASKLESISVFDSLTNYLGKDFSKYVGQELYLKGVSESLREYGYREFYIHPYRVNYDYPIYKPDKSKFHSSYDSLSGKYFKVLDIYTEIVRNGLGDKMYDNQYLKLLEKKSNDTVYFKYDDKYEHTFPFIVVGFFEKIKQQAIGKSFVFGSTDRRFGDDELDIKTGNPIKFSLGGKWQCIDVTIEEKYYNLSLILKDKIGQSMAVSYEMVIGPDKLYDVFTEKESDRYKAKFGIEIWNCILQGKARIGMTKEMCRLCWGDPKDINETITAGRKREQWVYSSGYLYFDNGKLTTIQ
jgi:hypothetical protein